VRLDPIGHAQQHRALQHILQLADIARPAVRHQSVDRCLGRPGEGFTLRQMAQHQRGGDRAHVEAALSERLQHQRHHIQTPVQVGAEPSFGDLGCEIAVGSRDDADIDRNRLGRADRQNFTLLERTQQLRLQRKRQFGDLV